MIEVRCATHRFASDAAAVDRRLSFDRLEARLVLFVSGRSDATLRECCRQICRQSVLHRTRLY